MRITVGGKQVELTPQLVLERLEGQQPEPIRQHWTDIGGTQWPVKQVIALSAGVGRSSFSSASARRWLAGLGFPIGQGAPRTTTPLGVLQDPAEARTLIDVMVSKGDGIKSPGLYSWWVDQAGARDLSLGLGFPVEPGLIHAAAVGGHVGAGSSNTLWGRIATIDLGHQHRLSTLRWSLGAVIAHAYRRPEIDEADLTRWMNAHLRVVTVPVDDPDELAFLEDDILRELDPPLNLSNVSSTPLRWRLSDLRKQYRGSLNDTDLPTPAPQAS